MNAQRVRIGAATLSVVVSMALLVAKFFAYRITGSTAVLSDALESIVKVVAAGFALWVVRVAARPAHREHPYGHGKLEYFSAVFEGGLITFAAGLIVFEAIRALIAGPELRRLDLGLAIVLGAGVVNAILGIALIAIGRRTGSIALVADGQHVLSDFWTSIGVVVGLLLVAVTDIMWLDPLVAIGVGANLARTGVRLVRQAAGGLVDEEDPALIRQLLAAFERTVHPGIIRLHHLRAIRSGRTAHVDAHVVVPEYWRVELAHDVVHRFGRRMMSELHLDGEIVFHTDPCRRAYCPACDVVDCPVRRAPFVHREPMTVEEATQPDPRLFLDPVS